jgi:hypothetical protein
VWLRVHLPLHVLGVPLRVGCVCGSALAVAVLLPVCLHAAPPAPTNIHTSTAAAATAAATASAASQVLFPDATVLLLILKEPAGSAAASSRRSPPAHAERHVDTVQHSMHSRTPCPPFVS